MTVFESGETNPVLQAIEEPLTLKTGLLTDGGLIPTSCPWSAPLTLRRCHMPCPEASLAARITEDRREKLFMMKVKKK